jgi:hypothetical protein
MAADQHRHDGPCAPTRIAVGFGGFVLGRPICRRLRRLVATLAIKALCQQKYPTVDRPTMSVLIFATGKFAIGDELIERRDLATPRS